MSTAEYQGTPAERAVASLLDVVEELAMKVADANYWAIVKETFDEHRAELGVLSAGDE